MPRQFPSLPRHSQTGAMFGLDARLAMLIFSILAVVAGYIGYGRIAIAHQAALIRELDNYQHALEAYQTDMGTFYLFTLNKADDDTSSVHDIEALWNPKMVKPGFRHLWHGPYLTYTDRNSRSYGTYSVFYAQGDRKNYCSTDSSCYVWLALTKVPAKVWAKINSYYDEANGVEPEPTDQAIAMGRVQADSVEDPRTLILRTVERQH